MAARNQGQHDQEDAQNHNQQQRKHDPMPESQARPGLNTAAQNPQDNTRSGRQGSARFGAHPPEGNPHRYGDNRPR